MDLSAVHVITDMVVIGTVSWLAKSYEERFIRVNDIRTLLLSKRVCWLNLVVRTFSTGPRLMLRVERFGI